jgi:hypothetical protein
MSDNHNLGSARSHFQNSPRHSTISGRSSSRRDTPKSCMAVTISFSKTARQRPPLFGVLTAHRSDRAALPIRRLGKQERSAETHASRTEGQSHEHVGAPARASVYIYLELLQQRRVLFVYPAQAVETRSRSGRLAPVASVQKPYLSS